MYNNKLILDYTSQISQKKIYRTMKTIKLTNSSLRHSNKQHLDSIKKQLNFDDHELVTHDYHDIFSQERNHKNAKTNCLIHLDDVKNIAIQLNFNE
jgi:hypothetical protein